MTVFLIPISLFDYVKIILWMLYYDRIDLSEGTDST